MKIWTISDTHCRHNLLNIPEDADMVIHCGDWTNNNDPILNLKEAEDFLDWYQKLPIKTKILVCGNHETFNKKFSIVNEIEDRGIHYLEHEAKNIEGIKFFGSPITPAFGKNLWAFNYDRKNADLFWSDIPDDTQILITHGPRFGILDLAYDFNCRRNIVQVGCKDLGTKIDSLNELRYHLFGHIHSAKKGLRNSGMYSDDLYVSINASCITDGIQGITNDGYVFDF
jgi:Icc-related predicted phosphoesterase